MAGCKQKRAKINAALTEAGLPELPAQKPIPVELRQLQAVAAKAARAELARVVQPEAIRGPAEQREYRANARQNQNRKLKRGTTVADVAGNDEIRDVLQRILRNDREPGSARIAAAQKLLELRGDTPQYQKYTLEVVLTPYKP